MYKIKVTSAYDNSARILRQTPQGKGVSPCGRYQFFVDDDTCEVDFWVVRNKSIKTRTTCKIAPGNTILMLSEPKSIVNYPMRYREQFGVIYSCQENLSNNNVVYTPAMLPWYVGKQNQQGEYLPNYDQLKNSAFPKKTKLISVITSNKSFTQGHQDRIDFVQKLKAYYGDKLDVFGRGINDFEDKWDVLAPYKYHIAIENSSSKYYWTEKISDCYLAGTFPIYFGCTNLSEYFPESAYREIDIYNFEEAVAIIDKIISSDTFEKSQNDLEQCKKLVLEDYNLINWIVKCCDKLNPNSSKKMVTLKPSITALDWHNFYLYFIERNILWAKRVLKSLLLKRPLKSK